MITVQIAAAILLGIRILSLLFVGAVVRRQLRLFRLGIHSDLVAFRVVMFLLGLVLLAGSIFPIYVDIFYSVVYTTAAWNTPLVIYATSNALTSLAASILLWNIYRIAGVELERQQEEMDKES